MKKVEAVIQTEVSKQVVHAIRKIGVEGVTLTQSLGQGEGERPEIGGQQIEFNSTDVVMTVVPDSKVKEVVAEIIRVSHTGEKSDGKIFVSNIEESYDIATKEKSQ